MSKYTTEVRYICEVKAGLTESKGFNDVDSILTTAAPNIFNFDFPIYDEQYRLVFEKMILRHFYVREIAFETVGLWQLKLWDKLNLIMPYYNQLYLSALLEFNPLYDVDYTVLHMGEASGSTAESENISEDKDRSGTYNSTKNTSDSGSRNVSENDTTSNTQWNLFSDTPQGGINGITADNDSVADNTYLTDARKITDDGSVAKQIAETDSRTIGEQRADTDSVSEDTAIARQKAGSVTNMDSYTDKVSGKRGGLTYAKMLKEFRETFLKIDEMVCKELEPLFFGLW